jgi:NAD(P)-dependent dehydrogenase (short-subunit alcohol dehydrogenase family)
MADQEVAQRNLGDSTRKSALVTGGTRGIGLGVARALAADGWDLLLSGQRAAAEVSAVVQDLQKLGSRVDYIAADISQPAGRAAIVERARANHGALNALVNNAGRAPRVRADLLEATEDSFEEVLRTNLQGPYFLTQAVARDQVARRRTDPSFEAFVVFITSVSAEMASPNRGDYCVSKAGLSMAARLFAARLAEHGIPVYEVRPGIVATDMTATVRESYDRRIADGLVPERRWGRPDDVGRVVAALVRGDLPYATGTVINVDGGLSIPLL